MQVRQADRRPRSVGAISTWEDVFWFVVIVLLYGWILGRALSGG